MKCFLVCVCVLVGMSMVVLPTPSIAGKYEMEQMIKEQHEFNMKMNDPEEYRKRKMKRDRDEAAIRNQGRAGSGDTRGGTIDPRTGGYYPGSSGRSY